MSKQNGLGLHFWYSGYDLGNDVRDFKSACPMKPHDVTPITKSAPERIGGQRDGSLGTTVFLDTAVSAAHEKLKTLPTTDQLQTVQAGLAIGAPALAVVAKQINYDPTRAADGMLTFASDAPGNGYGLDWCVLATAGKRTDSAATNGASLDLGSVSPGAFGAQLYLQVFAFTGTSATVKLQDSTDNGGADAFADVAGAAFAAVTSAPGWQRIAITGIGVDRYVRVVTTGTFSNLVFAVLLDRNPIAGVSF